MMKMDIIPVLIQCILFRETDNETNPKKYTKVLNNKNEKCKTAISDRQRIKVGLCERVSGPLCKIVRSRQDSLISDGYTNSRMTRKKF